MKKGIYVINSSGENEIVDKDELGLEGVENSEWEEVDLEGLGCEVIQKYEVYDSIGRFIIDEKVSDLEFLIELNRIDQELW